VSDEKGSIKIADRFFDETAQGFLDLEWDPERQVLFPRRRVASIVNPKHMQLRVGPIEGRHESMIRAMLTLVASLRRRIRDLEARNPGTTEEPQEPRSELETPESMAEQGSLPHEAVSSLPDPS
jgi:hypothetical protein